MIATPHGSISPWMDEVPESIEPLQSDANADVVVIGAGIAGLSVAYELIRRGRSVIVLDDGPVGGGETGRSTAHLASALDRRYVSLEAMHGREGAAICAESHAAAIDRIEAITTEAGIACDLMRLKGYLFTPPQCAGQAVDMVERELEAAARAGIRCALLAGAPGIARPTGPCLAFPGQAQFHPLHYLRGLARTIRARAGRIHTGSHVSNFSAGRHTSVTTSDGHTVSAGAIVIATNTPVNDVLTIHTKQIARRSYVVALAFPQDTIAPALYWDGHWDEAHEPYHYARLAHHHASGRELLIVGGEDHTTGREEDHEARYTRLVAWARAHFPAAHEIVYRWSGQIMEPHDEVAFIGKNPCDKDNVFIVTGDSGNGITHGVIAGLMLPDLIEERSHPWADLYSPARLPTAAPRTAIAETAEMVGEYRDWVTPHPHRQAEALHPGEGAVVREGASLWAVHREDDGRLTRCSAICPHLLGVVRWNPSERTWDCPCHGSRFDPRGHVLNGPANKDLAPEAAPAEPVEAHEPGPLNPVVRAAFFQPLPPAPAT